MQDYHNNLLFKKIHGYIAAGSIGNSMGELMEGYTVEERQQYWGWVDYLPEVTKHTPPRLPSVNDRAANPFDTGLLAAGIPGSGHLLFYQGRCRALGSGPLRFLARTLWHH